MQFPSKLQGPNFNTESVVIDRRGSGASPAYTVIYSGACDFQSNGGSEYVNPNGPMDISDGVINLDTLPSVKVGDRAKVTQNGVTTTYNIVNISAYTFPLTRLELSVKRGAVESRPHARR